MLERIKNEPALVVGVVTAVCNLVVGFGLVDLTTEQIGLINAVVVALLAFVTRSYVVPARNVVEMDAEDYIP